MSEGTMQPAVDAISTSTFEVEYSTTVNTGVFRSSIKLSDFPRIGTLRSLFASVVVNSITAEVRQDSWVGENDDELSVGGHIYVALIPTKQDTDATSGSSNAIINNVPNKQTFPLGRSEQVNRIFNFNLSGYEIDLAQDPRRGAGPVAWVGNSGVTRNGTTHMPICTVTYRLAVTCSGTTPLWQ